MAAIIDDCLRVATHCNGGRRSLASVLESAKAETCPSYGRETRLSRRGFGERCAGRPTASFVSPVLRVCAYPISPTYGGTTRATAKSVG